MTLLARVVSVDHGAAIGKASPPVTVQGWRNQLAASTVSRTAKAVGTVLAGNMNWDDLGSAYPGIKGLMQGTGYRSHHSIVKGLRELVAAGLIVKTPHARRYGYADEYRGIMLESKDGTSGHGDIAKDGTPDSKDGSFGPPPNQVHESKNVRRADASQNQNPEPESEHRRQKAEPVPVGDVTARIAEWEAFGHKVNPRDPKLMEKWVADIKIVEARIPADAVIDFFDFAHRKECQTPGGFGRWIDPFLAEQRGDTPAATHDSRYPYPGMPQESKDAWDAAMAAV